MILTAKKPSSHLGPCFFLTRALGNARQTLLQAGDSSDNHTVNQPSSLPAVAPPVTHYENFPVASWLCPKHLRAPIAAIYAFARTADDLADEGNASADERLADLNAYRTALWACAYGKPVRERWAEVFAPLQPILRDFKLPPVLLDDLLCAFIQDVEKTRDGTGYADRAQLLDYCRQSANPVGRLLLHLYGVHDAQSLAQSDAICSALQLINFWQDLSVDLPRGRWYLTEADCMHFGVQRADLLRGEVTPHIASLLANSSAWARQLMLQGAPLARRLPGRAGWELRLVVQGGLCILDKIDALQGANLHTRVTVQRNDFPRMAWRALRM